MNAEAFAMGEKIVFRQPNPSLHTVAHEAAHVIQQRAGMCPVGGVGRVDDKLERQADSVAQAVVCGGVAEPLLPPPALAPGAPAGSVRAAPAVQQLIFIGREPASPNDFRKFTRIVGFGKADRADRKFNNNSDNPDILKDNRGQVLAAEAVPVFTKAPAPVQGSDFDSSAILSAEVARNLAPEIDHIVSKKEGGSTSKNNARVLSKGQNNKKRGDENRPAVGATNIRIYRSYDIEDQSEDSDISDDSGPTPLIAGKVLNLEEAGLFYQFQTKGTLANLDSFSGADMKKLANSSAGTKNDVSITEKDKNGNKVNARKRANSTPSVPKRSRQSTKRRKITRPDETFD